VEVPEGGGDGMLATFGGRFGGYGMYVLKGKPVFTYNMLALARFVGKARMPSRLASTPSCSTLLMTAPGIAKGGTGVLKVDGKEVANQKIPHTIAFLMPADESFDIGVDTRTSVDDKDYQIPFRFTGTIHKLTQTRPAAVDGADKKTAAAAIAKAKD